MRALKVVLTALFALLAVAAGLFVAACIAAGSLLMLGLRRLSGSRPPAAATAPTRRSPEPAAAGGEIIDVTATEVRADPPA